MNDLLNPAQQRSVTVALKMMEEHLRQILQWMSLSEEEGVLFRRKIDLSEEERTKVMKKINEGLDLIAQLAERLNLQPVEEDLNSAIRSQMSVDWANMMDARAEKLAGYGAVNPSLALTLDPSIERLAYVALSLANLV